MTLRQVLPAVLLLSGCGILPSSGKDLTEEQLERFFRQHTVAGNNAVAIRIRFTHPAPGTAYVATIHGYPNNQTVCEDLIAPYNRDPTLTAIPGATYFCEELR